MVEVVQRLQKIGGSLMVRIPKDIADKHGFREGQLASLELKKESTQWLGACKGIGSWVKEDPEEVSKYG